jgi:hypothetical protein
MREILIETIPLTLSLQNIHESMRRGGNLVVETLLATSEKTNGNQRFYPRELWEREIDKYNQEFINNRTSTGELDHPDSSIINLKNVSHLITKTWWDGDKIYGKLEILPTPSGNIAKTLIESGVTLGISSRGMGSLKQVGDVMEVQGDFSLLCWDLVSTPSNPGSFLKTGNLNESLNNNINPYTKINGIITDILCSQGQCPIW